MNQSKQDEIYKGIPLWVRLFLIHVVKRSAGILIAWIDAMQDAIKEEQYQ